jgi:hypothetical protein
VGGDVLLFIDDGNQVVSLAFCGGGGGGGAC